MTVKEITVVQIIVFVFAGFFLGLGAYFGAKDHPVLAGAFITSTVILLIVGAVGHETIKKVGFDLIKEKADFERYIPTESEKEQAIDIVKDVQRASISDEPLVKSAAQRRDEEKSATDFLLLATNAWREKQYEKGLEYAYTGLALKPEDKRIKARLESGLGTLFKEIGADNQALRLYRQAIKTNPIFPWPHYYLGILLKDQGKLAEAELEYKKAIEFDPKHAYIHNNLGNLLYEQGKLTEADLEYRKAFELDPKDAYSHNNLGNLLKDQGKLTEAELEYRKAFGLDPKDAYPHNNLGNLLYEQGKLTEAEQEYRKAIELDPKHAYAHNNLDNLLKDQGKLTEAEQDFEKAKSLNQPPSE